MDSQQTMNMEIDELRESLELAESLAKASLMTPMSVKQRLAARSMEIEAVNSGYVPPKELLMYLVRMGSFTSATKIQNDDTQDNDLELPEHLTKDQLIQHCQRHLSHLPPKIKRSFRYQKSAETDFHMEPNTVIKEYDDVSCNPCYIRVFQWNMLSQALGVCNDNFVCAPEEALEWKTRKYRIIEEIIEYSPDVICLQEVDHFNFLNQVLSTQGYGGLFFPKPDSPCLYINGNNGPDGCAIFYKNSKYHLLKYENRILELWHVQSNQVAILAVLQIKTTGQEVCITTTHLKARSGALLSTLRNEQGKDLLQFINTYSGERPIILCGDFNAEPTEPVYTTVLQYEPLNLDSAYATVGNGKEPEYTTWKIREEGEICHVLDYIFYSKDKLKPQMVLDLPTGDEIGENRVPSVRYPSDHFSLVCDFQICNLSSSL